MSNPQAPVLDIPRVPWPQLQQSVSDLWKPLDAPHHSILGMNGSGKTYFTRHAIMPLVAWDKLVVIDVKGDDPTLRGCGKAVKELPSSWQVEWTRRSRNRKPGDLWFRLVVNPDWQRGREQVREVLERVWKEGRWFVVIDETRYLTDPRIPSLGLRPYVEQLWIRGRSRECCVVAMTQAPKWMASSFYDQASFVWIGRVNDEDAQKRLREIGGLSKAHLPVIQSLKKREWLLCADGGERLAITGI